MRLFAFLAWFLALVAQPALAQPALAQPALPQTNPHLQSLERRLAALATENPGEYGFAALDLTTGDMVSFNGNRPFPMASTMKIAVAAVYLSQVDAGQRRLYDMIGDDTASSLLDRMMVHSDNRATDQLIAALGGPTVIDGWLRDHQLVGIRVDRTIAGLLGDRPGPVGHQGFEHADGDARPAPADRHRRRAEPDEPRGAARHDAALRDRIEPDPRPDAAGRPGRAQDRHPQRLHRRRRLSDHGPTAAASQWSSSPAAATIARRHLHRRARRL